MIHRPRSSTGSTIPPTCAGSTARAAASWPTSCGRDDRRGLRDRRASRRRAGRGRADRGPAPCVFDTPHDRLIWDVGHQAYPAQDPDRPARAASARCASPAASRASPGASRATTTRSARAQLDLDLGRARHGDGGALDGRAQRGRVIGDGAMSAGMAYEAMNNAGHMNTRLIVILNDNDMSIAPPVGAMSAYLSGWSRRTPIAAAPAHRQAAGEYFPRACRAWPSGPRSSPAAWPPAARCSRSWASTISARSTATTSTT